MSHHQAESYWWNANICLFSSNSCCCQRDNWFVMQPKWKALYVCVRVFEHMLVVRCVNNLKSLKGKHMIIWIKEMLQVCLSACCSY